MSKTPSDRERMAGDTHKTEAANRDRPKFVSDDDILGRRHRPVRFTLDGKQKEPKFVSDEDIVQRRIA
jgi:hypothetical protein